MNIQQMSYNVTYRVHCSLVEIRTYPLFFYRRFVPKISRHFQVVCDLRDYDSDYDRDDNSDYDDDDDFNDSVPTGRAPSDVLEIMDFGAPSVTWLISSCRQQTNVEGD